MEKYNSYSCSTLLNYLDSLYEYDTDRTNYAEYLLLMQESSKIEELLNIYDNVFRKLIFIGDKKLVSETWCDTDTLSNSTREYLHELNFFLNENIERLFFLKDYSDSFALKCITNIREAINDSTIRERIFAKCSENVNSIKEKILSSLMVVKNTPNIISKYDINTNGYIKQRDRYIHNIQYLIENGYKKTFRDSAFERQTNINYITTSEIDFFIILFFVITVIVVGLYLIF